MVCGIKCGHHSNPGVTFPKTQAKKAGKEAHLAHARISEYGLRIRLRHANHNSEECTGQTCDDQDVVPISPRSVERQKADEPDQTRLDRSPTEDSCCWNRRSCVSQRHPKMQRHERNLHTEANG